MTRHLRAIRYCASAFIAMAAAPAIAADPQQPEAGLIQTHNTPCLLAKYGQGPQCRLPALPDGADATQQAAVRVSRAHFYIDTEDLRAAFLEADEALKLDPADVDIRHLVARLAMSIGDDNRAEREIKVALQQRPDDTNLQATNAARLLDTRHDEAEALRAFDQILSTHPDHRFSRESRAGLLLTLGRPREAVADLDILLAGDHRDANLLARRGTANLAAGNPRQAVADITEALKEIPGGYYLIIERAAANEILGDDDAALRDYDTLLGPIGGQPNYAIGGNELAKFRMQRALVSVRLKRFSDAAAEAIAALNVGGRRSLLKAEIFLRQNGFPEIPLDGQSSENLKKAMQACMGLNSCFEKISGSL
jgi:tetratricopeptide (TPR) repeat protein